MTARAVLIVSGRTDFNGLQPNLLPGGFGAVGVFRQPFFAGLGQPRGIDRLRADIAMRHQDGTCCDNDAASQHGLD